MFPIFSFSIPLHVKYRTIAVSHLVRFGKPVKSASTSWLPFHAEGVRRLEVFGYDLLHGPDGIGLECLIGIACYRFIWLRGSEICSVEEGIKTSIPGHG